VAPRITTPPVAPANVQASDGIYNSRVLVTWDPADTATKYMVYRGSTSQTNAAVAVSGEIAGISFSDTNAVTGVTNYYFVQAGNSIGWSDLGSGDPGFRGSGSAVDIAGFINDPNTTYGYGVNYNLYGATTFGSAAGTIGGDMYFSVYDLSLEPTAAQQTSLDGSLSGSGDLIVNGQDGASVSQLGGSQPNTRSGETIVNGGVLALAKPSGVSALAGDITLDGNSQPAILQLDTSHQVADTARLTISGKTGGWLRTGGFSETFGALDIQAQALIELGLHTGDLHFADSSAEYWNPNVNAVIWQWHADSCIYFGTTSSGLTSAQRDMILFKDPAGHAEGMYSAALQSDGELVPGAVIPPAFDESPAAQAAREVLYSNPGLALLSGASTPLESGMVINFFGDSITWLDNANSYVNIVKSSLAAGAGTSGLGIVVNRRGINGGTAGDILNGKSGVQAPFATLLSQDQPDIVAMFIGINDIWWAGTSAAAYESTMREIVAQAQASGVVHFVMATPWLRNEKPDGSNINDAKIVQFAGICSNIAADTDVIFVDLHQLAMWYLQNNNNAHLFNFIPDYKNSGILTYDGVHSNPTGAEFLANQLSYGILQSMGVPEPAVLLPVGVLMLARRRFFVIGNR
jgi:lysophospholipase L1-like esterase